MSRPPIEKMQTGIPGFEFVSEGGLPRGRTTLVSGTSGSAKSVLAMQFIAEGILKGEPGVFVTFEEPVEDIRRNMRSLGWALEDWERDGTLVLLDASPATTEGTAFVGRYDLEALLARVRHAVERSSALRLSFDSIGGIFAQFPDAIAIRREIARIARALNAMGVTSVVTAERADEYGPISRYGVEEFVADNVVVLRNVLEEEKRRRTIEVLKFRGARHQKGEYPFTILPGRGIIVLPLAEIPLKQPSTRDRIASGNGELDEMCGGGFFRDSIVLASGATGTGKTLLTTEFLAGGMAAGERVLLFAFEESREQLFRNAAGWGKDFERYESDGLLKVVCRYPEVSSLEELFIDMRATIEEFKPSRVAVDSLSALERASSEKGFREFAIGLTAILKEKQIAGLVTVTTSMLTGTASVSERHISTITDAIILLRYVELFGEMRRGVMVLKMRGSPHDKSIREYTIDGGGMHIGAAFRDIEGILVGAPKHVTSHERERMNELFAAAGGRQDP